MSADIEKNSYDVTKQYNKILWQKSRACTDFELNEAQDIIRGMLEQSMSTLGETGNIFGGSGYVTPAGSARSVSIAGGESVQNGSLIRIPTTATLAVFSGGTSTGTVTSCIYVEWWDSEVTSSDDAGLLSSIVGSETARRTKRNVQVNVNIGASIIPSLTGGHTAYILALVTHNFDVNGTTILQSDITMSATGLTPGELAGLGPVRSLLLKSRAANAATAYGYVVDTITNLTTAGAKLMGWRNAGVEKAWVDKDGNFSGGTYNGIDLSLIGPGGNAILHSALVGLTSGDPHTQYVALAAARTITAVHTFSPGSASAPFILGTNALGQLVTGLNAERLNGQLAAFYTNATNITAGTLPAAQLPATAMQTDVAQTVTAKKTYTAASAALMVAARVTADTVDRWNVDTGGIQTWGSGGGAVDTNLYRNGAGVLKTDGTLQVNVLQSVVAIGTAPLLITSTTLVSNLNAERLNGQLAAFYTNATNITAGTLADGQLSANVLLKASAQISTALKTFQAGSTATAVAAFQVAADTVARLAITSDGIASWSTGAATADTNLYRSAVGTLKTDGALIAAGALSALAGATVTGLFTVNGQSYVPEYDNGNSGAIDWNNGNGQLLTLNGNKTITCANVKNGAAYVLRAKQGGTGSYQITWPGGSWDASGAPTLSTVVGKFDLFAGYGAEGVVRFVRSGIGY